MASAKKVIKKTEVVVVKDEVTIDLNLSLYEARTLLRVLGQIGGSSKNTARKYISSIYSELQKLLGYIGRYDKIIEHTDYQIDSHKNIEDEGQWRLKNG